MHRTNTRIHADNIVFGRELSRCLISASVSGRRRISLLSMCLCTCVCDTRSCASVCQWDALTRSPDFRSTRWEKREMGCNRAQDAGQTKRWFSDASPCLTELLYQTQYRHSYLNRHKHLWNKTDAGRVNIRVTSLMTSLHRNTKMAVHEYMTEKGDRFNNDYIISNDDIYDIIINFNII